MSVTAGGSITSMSDRRITFPPICRSRWQKLLLNKKRCAQQTSTKRWKMRKGGSAVSPYLRRSCSAERPGRKSSEYQACPLSKIADTHKRRRGGILRQLLDLPEQPRRNDTALLPIYHLERDERGADIGGGGKVGFLAQESEKNGTFFASADGDDSMYSELAGLGTMGMGIDTMVKKLRQEF